MCGNPKLFVNNKPHGEYGKEYGSELSVDINGRFSEQGGAFCEGVYIYVALQTNPFLPPMEDHLGRPLVVRVTKDREVNHAMLAQGRNVCYAGTVEFAHGVIGHWCNGSGHYEPDGIYCDQAPSVFPLRLFGWIVNAHRKGAFWSWEGKTWYRNFTGDDAYDWVAASDRYLTEHGI
jgi:hypothetical protein